MFKIVRDLATFIIGLVSVLLVFRFVLRLLAANPSSAFVNWVYETTQPLLSPFLFAFPTPSVKGGFTLEFTTLFALFAYTFIGYLVQELLELIDRKGR
jgi:uncharacterized protein YggT (Ycf19 family)